MDVGVWKRNSLAMGCLGREGCPWGVRVEEPQREEKHQSFTLKHNGEFL